LLVILLEAIGDYSIDAYWLFFYMVAMNGYFINGYWWVLVDISGYFINGYWWLLYCRPLVVIY